MLLLNFGIYVYLPVCGKYQLWKMMTTWEDIDYTGR